jgi:flagellin-like protein
MKLKQLFTDESAVSPVIGVILMVAITVLLAATAASFFLGLTGQNVDAPTAAIQFDYTKQTDSTDRANHVLVIKHAGGDSLKAKNVDINLNGARTSDPDVPAISNGFDWNELKSESDSEITAGMQTTISRQTLTDTGSYALDDKAFKLNKASVTVSWSSPETDKTFTLAEWQAPTA